MSSLRKSSKITVAMLGARRHYAVPRLLNDAGLLEQFFTDSYIGNKPMLKAALNTLPLGNTWKRRWLDREDSRLPPEKVTSFELLGIRYALNRRRCKSKASQEAVFSATSRRFNTAILGQTKISKSAIWGFNTASLELFRAAKQKGTVCILDQTILPRRLEANLLESTAADWKGWQPGFRAPKNGGILAEREELEWKLADFILVGSNFVREGLIGCGVPQNKITVIPYGVETSRFSASPRTETGHRPLRVLFVGEVGLRKGAPHLLEALLRLGPENVEARLVGKLALDPKLIAPYTSVATFLGAVPRAQVAEMYRWADVFVLPSIVEGSAASCYEALLSGLSLVVTPNAGTIIEHDDAGQIVQPRNTDSIEHALRSYCESPDLLARHQAGALALRDMASSDRYGRDLVKFAERISCGW